MSRNVSKPSKRTSYHVNSGYANNSSHQQVSNQLSLDLSKDKELITLPKDILPHSTHSTSPKNSIKKLGQLLDSHKDKSLASRVMAKSTGNSMHTSPKSFLEATKKFSSKGKTLNISNSSDVSLVSPKELVRKAMSKISAKENVKQEIPRRLGVKIKSLPKSLTLSLNHGYVPSIEKRMESNKNGSSTTTLEESMFPSRNKSSPKNDKAERLMKLQRIYNDDGAKMARLNTQSSLDEQLSPQRQHSMVSSQSQTGLLWSTSVVTSAKISRAPSATFSVVGDVEKLRHYKTKMLNEAEKGHQKGNSIGQIDLFTKKEIVPATRPRTNSHGNKVLELRKVPFVLNPQRVSPVSFNQFNQNNSHILERPSSPVLITKDDISFTTVEEAPFDTEEMLTDEGTLSVTNRDYKKTVIPIQSHGESATNTLIKPQRSPLAFERVDLASDDSVKLAQTSLLEKLRDTLGNKDFVRREDYERVVRDRIKMEEELYVVKEENKKLRSFFTHMKTTGFSSDSFQELKEIIAKQQAELKFLRKREVVVKKVFQMMKVAEVDNEEFGTEENESSFFEKEFNTESSQDHPKPLVNVYASKPKNKESHLLTIPIQVKSSQTEESFQDSQFHQEVLEQTIDDEIGCLTEEKSVIEHKISDEESSFYGKNTKKQLHDAKSTADSSPLFSSNVMSMQSGSLVKSKTNGNGKFSLDMARVGGNISTVKSKDLSNQSSGEKFHP